MNWQKSLCRPVPAYTLAALRIAFGVLLFVEIVVDWTMIDRVFPAWEYTATYQLLEPLRGWIGQADTLAFALMSVSLFFVAFGLFTRTAAACFTLAYIYQYLLDPTHWNNHYYLIALFGFWLSIVRSDAVWSVSSLLRKPPGLATIPAWQIWVFRVQLMIVYFFGGIAKFNADWLQGEPVRVWLAVERDRPIVGPLLDTELATYFVAYFGLIFDLLVPWLLLSRKMRPYAVLLAIGFHLSNMFLFRIGVFPWLGIASLVVFFEYDTPKRFTGWLRNRFWRSDAPSDVPASPLYDDAGRADSSRLLIIGLGIYFLLQCVLPFRHFLFAGNTEWTEEGKHFAWRMMLSHKHSFAVYRIFDPDRGLVFTVDHFGNYPRKLGKLLGRRRLLRDRQKLILVPQELLSSRQTRGKGVLGSPRLAVQYGQYLAREARLLGIEHPQVYVELVSSLNGRPLQFLVDPDVDLTTAARPLLRTAPCIVPLKKGAQPGRYLPVSDFQAEAIELINELRARYRQP